MSESKAETNTGKDRPGVIAPPPVIYAIIFGLGALLQRLAPLGLPEDIPWNAIGKALTGLAILLAISGIITMKRAGTHVDVYKPSKVIVSSGPFRFSRNPLYLSLTTLYVGIALAEVMLWPLLVLPLALALMHTGVISREERYLTGKFGEEYLQYKARVRRWL